MKSIYLIFVLQLIFASCITSDDQGIRLPYYSFSNIEKQYIIDYPYQLGEEITFKNQNNDILKYKVTEIKDGKTGAYSSGTFSGGGGILEGYFDIKYIELQLVQFNDINPCCNKINYIFSKSNNNFKAAIGFSFWNKRQFTFVDEMQYKADILISYYDFYNQISTEINNTIYSNVIKFESNTLDEINNSQNIDIFINEVYYDVTFGIIKFKDINNVEWEIVNP